MTGSFISIVVSIFLCIYIVFTGMDYDRKVTVDIESQNLEIQANYSADAAMTQMVQTTLELSQDYGNTNAVEVDPNIGVETYLSFMLANRGIPNTEEARKKLLAEMPFIVVANEDGYHLATSKDILKTQHNVEEGSLIFEPKKPYLLEKEDKLPTDTDLYLVSIHGSKINRISTYVSSISGNSILKTESVPRNQVGSERYIKKGIADNISHDVIRAMYERFGDTARTFKIPIEDTNWRNTNPITGTTFLTYGKHYSAFTRGVLEVFTIAATRVTAKRPIIGYERNINGVTQKLYCYVDLMGTDANLVNNPTYFATIEEAAKRGYYFDMKYLRR